MTDFLFDSFITADFGWVKDFLECCLKQIENRRSLSKKMNDEGLPEIFYKVTADYEMLRFEWDRNEDSNVAFPVPLTNEISRRTPANDVALREKGNYCLSVHKERYL